MRSRFLNREQQDAHELLEFVLNSIHDDLDHNSLLSLSDVLSPLLTNTTTQSNSIINNLSTSSPFVYLATQKSNLNNSMLSNSTLSNSSLSNSYLNNSSLCNSSYGNSGKIENTNRNPFMGLLKNSMQCTLCHKVSPPSYQKFFDLSLPIPENYGMNANTLENCLRYFTTSEIVYDVDCSDWLLNSSFSNNKNTKNNSTRNMLLFATNTLNNSSNQNEGNVSSNNGNSGNNKSKRCIHPTGASVAANKQLSIARCPVALCLHLRRLIVTPMGFSKLNCYVKFPLELDLTPYCSFTPSSKDGGNSGKNNNTSVSKDTIVKSKTCTTTTRTASIVGGNHQDNDYSNYKVDCDCCTTTTTTTSASTTISQYPTSISNKLLYKLISVIVHHGNHFGGHYVCYVRRNLDQKVYNKLSQNLQDQFKGKVMLPTLQNNKSSDISVQQQQEQWIHISDESIRRVSVDEVLRSQAYMLYYEKL